MIDGAAQPDAASRFPWQLLKAAPGSPSETSEGIQLLQKQPPQLGFLLFRAVVQTQTPEA